MQHWKMMDQIAGMERNARPNFYPRCLIRHFPVGISHFPPTEFFGASFSNPTFSLTLKWLTCIWRHLFYSTFTVLPDKLRCVVSKM